ncbi:acyl-ACP thioesterase [Streptococcus pseudoporcinus]|uniref:Acyl-ACP thioesterase n=1 Tax=Streptococcus pseudoporcinus TaxID=361101 RepID=A0A4U9YMU8_9STRE|nr:acyl-ACP thioesterase domain-containing protein [Streptococcus pseudoporcinus]VTS28263.1 acyl-ACP thioesterase [Streptococcus pseudoporcinus]
MGLPYKESFTMPFDLCDVKHDAKLPLLLAYCLTVSGCQSQLLGRSDAYLLEQFQLVWIITDYEVKIKRLPLFNETITIQTEALSYNKLFCYRQFDIYDQEGNQLADILTYFALMNPETRKVAPIPEEVVAPYQTEFVKKIRRAFKAAPLENPKSKDYHVRYFDIDMNGHVNNSKYLDWIYDSLGYDFLRHHNPVSLRLKYVKEVAPGGQIRSLYVQEDLTTRHEIVSDGQVNAQAIIQWQKIEK